MGALIVLEREETMELKIVFVPGRGWCDGSCSYKNHCNHLINQEAVVSVSITIRISSQFTSSILRLNTQNHQVTYRRCFLKARRKNRTNNDLHTNNNSFILSFLCNT